MSARRRASSLRRSLPLLTFALVAVLLLALPAVALCASGDLVWTYSEGSPSHALEGLSVVAPGPNGSMYAGGGFGYDWHDGGDLALFRLRPTVAMTDPVIWLSTWDNPDFHSADYPIDLIADPAGNAIAGGQTNTTTGGMDWIVGKWLSSGVPAWDVTFGGPQGLDDWIDDVARDAAGNVYACGSIGVAANDTDAALVKFRASDGKPLWTYIYSGAAGSTGRQSFAGLALNAQRQVYVTGLTTDANGYQDVVVIKVKTDGSAQWKRRIDGAAHGHDYGEGIGFSGGAVYVAGESTASGGGTAVLAAKYSESGARKWLRTWRSAAGTIQQISDVAVASDGATRVAGAVLLGQPDSKAFLVKWTAAGVRRWAKTYWKTSTAEPAAFNDIVVDGAGRIWAAGHIGVTDTSQDGLLARYRPDGVRVWSRRHDGYEHLNDWFNCVRLWGSTAVFVGGVEGTTAGSDDMLAARFVR